MYKDGHRAKRIIDVCCQTVTVNLEIMDDLDFGGLRNYQNWPRLILAHLLCCVITLLGVEELFLSKCHELAIFTSFQ